MRLPARSVGAGRQTVWIPAPALQPRLTAGAAPAAVELPGNLLVLRTLDFDPQAQEHAQLLVQMPKAWNRGALTAAFLWTHGPAATTFNVVWGLRVLAATDAALLDAPFGTAVQVTDTGGTSLALSRSADTPGASPATPPGENSLVALDIFRAAGRHAGRGRTPHWHRAALCHRSQHGRLTHAQAYRPVRLRGHDRRPRRHP
jgi:hypothetical protein